MVLVFEDVAAHLLVLQDLVDNDLPASIDGDDFVDGDVAAQGDVDDVVAGIEDEVDGRIFIQHVLVDGYLGSLRLSLDVDRAHTLGFFITEQLAHFPDGFDVIDIPQRLECGREICGLAQKELRAGGLVNVAGFAHQNDVLALLDGDLGGSELAGVLAVNKNVGSSGAAGNGEHRHEL